MSTEETLGQSYRSLAPFHPLIRQWFRQNVGEPTEVQERAWPVIARGEHVLVSAPTGTGKTLAAFLWGINQLVTGALSLGTVRILYISPLKALNNDIERNLLGPLAGLRALFAASGETFPDIRVQTRSGDTPANERRRMQAHPPEILITTPESLNLIISSPRSRLMLGGVATVILDEIHAVADTKRGVHLITAVDRLVRLSGEFQRIALSATVKPLRIVAEFVGGFIKGPGEGEERYRPRPVQIVHCPMSKRYELSIAFSATGTAAGRGDEPMFDALARECRTIIANNRATLFFVNSRRHAEKLARFINEGQPEPLAWAHHGSLSRELRLVVEQRLKRGELKAIVATSSLELGIDIGSLDRVVLVSTPFTVASTLQRLGRAGHRVGEPSRGVLYPLHEKDIVDAAVMSVCVREQDINEISPVLCPLDVLAQIIVSMTSVETWRVDELFDTVRTSFPFRALPRRQFDLVIEMLAGRYEETRLRDLSALLSLDRLDGTVRAREGARIRLVTNGGTIPDRGYFGLRLSDSKALIGELDEEFVWERSLGDTFVFGSQGWRIQRIDNQNVEVVPTERRMGMSPFWKGDTRGRDFHLSQRIAEHLEEWDGHLGDEGFSEQLIARYGMEASAADAMIAYLARQKETTGRALPHRHHLLVEHTRDPDGKGEGVTLVLHTLWGGTVNRPYSLALAAALEDLLGYRPQMFQTDDSILLFLHDELGADDLVNLVTPENTERLLRHSLEGSGFFGARFRESAGRSLLLPRASARGRTPLWLTRQRAKTLYAAVTRYDDFPLLVETWRTCLQDEFDLGSLGMVLAEIAGGVIAVSETNTSAPSPFCSGLVWQQTNSLMYADDAPSVTGATNVRGELIREIALSADLRPRLSREVIDDYVARRQRTADGYAPRDSQELLDWLKERVLLTESDWETLINATIRDYGMPREQLLEPIAAKIVRHHFEPAGPPVFLASEVLARIERARGEKSHAPLSDIVGEWLRFQGPVDPMLPSMLFGILREDLDEILTDLVEEESVVLDRLAQGTESLLLCDREALESLLRLSRARARPAEQTLPLECLPVFVARHQGLLDAREGREDMKGAWERLFGFPLPVHLWEEEVFPIRFPRYRSRAMDELIPPVMWLGCGTRKMTFCFGQDADLFHAELEKGKVEELFPAPQGRYAFWDLADHARSTLGIDSRELAARLWAFAWRGEVTSDTFQPVRQGIANGFKTEETARPGARRGRGLDRWQSLRPSTGHWALVPRDVQPRDALEEEEISRDRIRQVLERYGVIFRELLESELPPLRWSRLFRSLRLMEFSGEVVTGRFFDGIHGLQFALPSVLEELRGAAKANDVWWINACDPASLAGVDIAGLKAYLPSRLSTTHLVFEGRSVVLVSRRRARDLEIRVSPDELRADEHLAFLRVLTERDVRPLNAVHVETINKEPAPYSAYRSRLVDFGFEEEYRRLTLRARP